MIRLAGVSVVVDGRTLLSEVSLLLTEQRIAVIGANGSGKSTLARCLNGLVLPTSGTVTVDDLDVAKQGREVRRIVAFGFTDPAAQLVMPTVVEDVELSLRPQHPRRAERRAAALDWLRHFGLEAQAEQSVHSLSGGQRQLLALASVLATGPRVLVADEPTTLLDLRNSREIAALLFGLEQQLVLVTHDLDLAARCERVLWVDAGQIAGDGGPEVVENYRESVR